MQVQSSDSTPEFTDGVNKLVKNQQSESDLRDSLDFNHQRDVLNNKANPNQMYRNSRKLKLLKNQYQRGNVLGEIVEVHERGEETQRMRQDPKSKELAKLKKKALQNLPWFQEIDDI